MRLAKGWRAKLLDQECTMKLVLSALAALVLGTAVLSTDASAQPRCWWNGVNHCYYNHHGWQHGWHHNGYWHNGHWSYYR